MAGNQNSGRKRVPLRLVLDSRTYRPSVHGPIPDEAGGVAKRPAGMSRGARVHWDRIVPDLISRGLAKAIDSCALQALCELWDMASRVQKLMSKSPADAKLAAVYRGYLREYGAIAQKFGLTPRDRQRMRLTDKPQEKPAGIPSRQRS